MERLTLKPSKRKKWKWTKQNKRRAADIATTLNELREYWPLTLRHAFYRLISSDLVNEDHWMCNGKRVDVYAAMGRTLKWMRIHDMIEMNAITDEHRILTQKVGFTDPENFIEYSLKRLGAGYSRCNAQKQSRHIEIWIEKATLLHIIEPIADEFCRRVVVCRGYGSITFQAQFYERAMEAKGYGQIPTVLYFGDWDPSGVNMMYAAMETIEIELGLSGVEFYRCGINPEHFNEIPSAPVPIKGKDPRTGQFIEEHGTAAYELDAFHPERLQMLVRDSLIAMTDIDQYLTQIEQQKEDLLKIANWRESVRENGAGLAIQMGILKV